MKSMTGFGKCIKENEEYQLDVEIKSVNNRFLDIQIRSPKQLNPFELEIRKKIKERLQRGRLDIFINLKEKGAGTKQVVVQWPLVDQLVDELKQGLSLRGEAGQSQLLQELLPTIISQADYVSVEETQEEASSLEALVLETVEGAVQSIDDSRSKEGAGIHQVLTDYQRDFAKVVTELRSFNTTYEEDFRQRFETKLKTWLGDQVNEDRLVTEMALLLERGDIHEELDRLMIHLDKLESLLQKIEPVGRELDFLIQEMNREVNTIGSKSSPIEIKNMVVDLKTILEKIREQVQNVE